MFQNGSSLASVLRAMAHTSSTKANSRVQTRQGAHAWASVLLVLPTLVLALSFAACEFGGAGKVPGQTSSASLRNEFPFIVTTQDGVETSGLITTDGDLVTVELDGQVSQVSMADLGITAIQGQTTGSIDFLGEDGELLLSAVPTSERSYEVGAGAQVLSVSFPDGFPTDPTHDDAGSGQFAQAQAPLAWFLAIPFAASLTVALSSTWCWGQSKLMCWKSGVKVWKVWSGGYCYVQCK